jgi:hypothetical protein
VGASESKRVSAKRSPSYLLAPNLVGSEVGISTIRAGGWRLHHGKCARRFRHRAASNWSDAPAAALSDPPSNAGAYTRTSARRFEGLWD